jgi:uncharacterized repeat protein (TIGR01451 family)
MLAAIVAAAACAFGAPAASADLLPADLSVSVSGAPGVAVAGADLTYTITVANAGPFDAHDVTVADTLPPGTAFESISAPGLTCAGETSCSISTLAAGATATISLTAGVPPSTPALSWLEDTATVTSSNLDPIGANDTAATATPVVTVADLSTTVSPVVSGGNVTWRVGLHNAGPSDAEGARVAMPIPPGTTFVSATQLSGSEFTCAHDGANIRCSRARMPAGDDASFEFVLAAAEGATRGKPLASAATTDPDHSNDESSATAEIAPAAGPLPAAGPDPPAAPVPDPPPVPDAPTQLITLGNAVEGANSGAIFVPVGCMNELLWFCRTTVTITFRKPHGYLKPIKRRLRIASGQTSVAFMSGSLAQRKRIRVIRRLKIMVTASNPPGPPVKRGSTLSGHPPVPR